MIPIIHAQKAALRKSVEKRRRLLDEKEIIRSNRQIMHNMMNLPAYQQAKMIFCFVSTPAEIDTRPIMEDAFVSNKHVCVPRCISKGIMRAYGITGPDDLQPGKYDIPEPKSYCQYIDPAEIDFVIVPCVTCNVKGHRLGYGGGVLRPLS